MEDYFSAIWLAKRMQTRCSRKYKERNYTPSAQQLLYLEQSHISKCVCVRARAHASERACAVVCVYARWHRCVFCALYDCILKRDMLWLYNYAFTFELSERERERERIHVRHCKSPWWGQSVLRTEELHCILFSCSPDNPPVSHVWDHKVFWVWSSQKVFTSLRPSVWNMIKELLSMLTKLATLCWVHRSVQLSNLALWEALGP